MTFKKITVIIIMIFSNINLTAQTNFEAGFIINHEGDTLLGLIDNRYWELHPTFIHFKHLNQEQTFRFTPEDIAGFGVGKIVFQSHKIEFDNSPYKTNELSRSPIPEMIEMRAFVQVLFAGEKSLYHYKDIHGKNHFFIDINNELVWLHYRRYLNVNKPQARNTGLYIENVERYKGQLLSYLDNDTGIKSHVEKTSYNRKSLVKLFHHYYDGHNYTPHFVHSDFKLITKIGFGLMAGISLTKMDFKGPALPWLSEGHFPTSTKPTFGVGIEIVFPRNNYKHSAIGEIVYTSFETQDTYLHYQMGDFETYKHTYFNISYLKPRVLYQHNFNFNNIKLFGNAGLSFGLLMNDENVEITERREYGTMTSETKSEVTNIRKFDPGIVAGIGMNYNGLVFKVTYEISKGISEIVGLSSVTDRYYFTLGYSLFD